MTDRASLERAFRRVREELGIRAGFAPEVLAAAEAAAGRREWETDPERLDLTDVPFVTVDPPGSRDLDQALHIESTGRGWLVRYAIADVGCFVDRGGPVEAEAWLRGLTYYSPDGKEPLYPEVLGQGAASLLPDGVRPAVVFALELDATGELVGRTVRRARVRSRRQLTYEEALDHILGGGARFGGEPFAESLLLLRAVGTSRRERERARGGVSLPILDQHVQRQAAHRLGYQLRYELPNEAEEWNAQISLLAGHAAALRMLEAGVGLLRVMPPPRAEDVARLRVAARALGFHWLDSASYPEFVHSLRPEQPNLTALIWQARRLMRGADYVAFQGDPPPLAAHAALAMPYAHCTAPLRRLADRYVLDLLVTLDAGARPGPEQVARLHELPARMDEAERRAAKLERTVVDVAEAWELHDCVGREFGALVLAVGPERLEAELTERPVRARVPLTRPVPGLAPGAEVRLRLVEVSMERGEARFELLG